MIFLTPVASEVLDEGQRKVAEAKFNEAVDKIITNHLPMSKEAMAELFDEDGYLGSAMRSMLNADEPEDFGMAA